jgi:acyl carrier protein
MSRLDDLRGLLAEVFSADPAELDDDASPDKVSGWDSLTHLNMTVAVEERFGVTLSTDDIMEMQNVGAIRRVLRAHGVAV